MSLSTIRLSLRSPDPLHRNLKSGFGHIRFLDWPVPPRIDEGLESNIKVSLAYALTVCGRVLFLQTHAGLALDKWVQVSGATWQVRTRHGFIPGLRTYWLLTLSSEASAVALLFDDAYYNWHQGGQLVLLFPHDFAPEALRLDRIVLSIDRQDIGEIADCIGYLRPGHDGYHPELGTRDGSLLDRFAAALSESRDDLAADCSR